MTAYLLNRQAPDLEIVLFEASPRLGGKIVTAQLNNAPLHYEAGTAELYDYSMTGPDPLKDPADRQSSREAAPGHASPTQDSNRACFTLRFSWSRMRVKRPNA